MNSNGKWILPLAEIIFLLVISFIVFFSLFNFFHIDQGTKVESHILKGIITVVFPSILVGFGLFLMVPGRLFLKILVGILASILYFCLLAYSSVYMSFVGVEATKKQYDMVFMGSLVILFIALVIIVNNLLPKINSSLYKAVHSFFR